VVRVRQVNFGQIRLQTQGAVHCRISQGALLRNGTVQEIKVVVRLCGCTIGERELWIESHGLFQKTDRVDQWFLDVFNAHRNSNTYK
jgi:hypothetical protein